MFPGLAVKKCSKSFFVAGVLSRRSSVRHKKFRWPVKISTLRKGPKFSKFLKMITIFSKILVKFAILISPEPFDFLTRLSNISIPRPKKFHWLIKINELGT